MLEQLQAIFIHPTKQIKLRFRYILPTRQVKILEFLLDIRFIQAKQLTVYKFLTTVMNELLSPILQLQNENVYWDTVSIVYPLKNDTRCDILKIPLLELKGSVEADDDNNNLKVLNISVRFEGRPMPLNTKIYGIDLNAGDFINENIVQCINIYTQNYSIQDTGIVYRIIFQTPKKIRKTKQDVMLPIMAFANIT